MMHIGRSQMDAHTRAFENVLLQEAYIFIPLVWGSIGFHFGSVRETSSQPTVDLSCWILVAFTR